MTEIPLPPSEGYGEPKKGSCLGGCNKVLCVLIIAVIVIAGVIAVVLNSSPSYESRVINSWTDADVDPDTVSYYRAGFTVSTSELGGGAPTVRFEVTVDNGNDAGSVDISMHVYECSVATVDAAPTWDDLSTYTVDWDYDTGSMYTDVQLYDYAQTYTWVLMFHYDGVKSDVWSSDMTITLLYNWA
ncbi:MAG: hypothetical protein EAX95_07090 [Candidatus Thorarchaeota archaeon]|nr:hypothetical protein [Candidatus Thorarchaeota archaeon]